MNLHNNTLIQPSTIRVNGIAAGHGFGLQLVNDTLATAPAQRQNSPQLILKGRGWTGAIDQSAEMKLEVRPIPGANPISANLVISSSIGGAGDVDILQIDNVGALAAAASVTAPSIGGPSGAFDLLYANQSLIFLQNHSIDPANFLVMKSGNTLVSNVPSTRSFSWTVNGTPVMTLDASGNLHITGAFTADGGGGGGGGSNYQTVRLNGVDKPVEPKLNFSVEFTTGDTAAVSTDIGLATNLTLHKFQSGVAANAPLTAEQTGAAADNHLVSFWQGGAEKAYLNLDSSNRIVLQGVAAAAVLSSPTSFYRVYADDALFGAEMYAGGTSLKVINNAAGSIGISADLFRANQAFAYNGAAGAYQYDHLQYDQSSSPKPGYRWKTGAISTISVGAEFPDYDFDGASTKTWTAGDVTLQRGALFRAPSWDIGAHVMTTGATVAITGAPTAVGSTTITNPLALLVQAGQSRMDNATAASAPLLLQQTGAAGANHLLALLRGGAEKAFIGLDASDNLVLSRAAVPYTFDNVGVFHSPAVTVYSSYVATQFSPFDTLELKNAVAGQAHMSLNGSHTLVLGAGGNTTTHLVLSGDGQVVGVNGDATGDIGQLTVFANSPQTGGVVSFATGIMGFIHDDDDLPTGGEFPHNSADARVLRFQRAGTEKWTLGSRGSLAAAFDGFFLDVGTGGGKTPAIEFWNDGAPSWAMKIYGPKIGLYGGAPALQAPAFSINGSAQAAALALGAAASAGYVQSEIRNLQGVVRAIINAIGLTQGGIGISG